MKRVTRKAYIFLLIALLCTACIFFVSGQSSIQPEKALKSTLQDFKGEIILQIGNPKMYIEKSIDEDQNVVPLISGDRTLVPIRSIVETVGGRVEWDAVEKKITIRYAGKKIVLWVDKNEAMINNVRTTMDVAPQVINDRTMLPLRFVTEKMGAVVDWNQADKKITLKFNRKVIFEKGMIVTSSNEESYVPQKKDPSVVACYTLGDSSGSTSIRFMEDKEISKNKYPLDSVTVFGNRDKYPEIYQKRDRDLGQTFVTGSKECKLDALYMRVGPKIKFDITGAKVAIQFFEVNGEPKLNDHGTPGFTGDFNRKTAPHMDDFIEGEEYRTLFVATGELPNNLKPLDYLKFDLKEECQAMLEPNKTYAFMLMFVNRTKINSLAFFNQYIGKYKPVESNPYAGHAIRREGLPDLPDSLEERVAIQPGTIGFPDVCTYRDFYFFVTATPSS